MIVVGVAAFVMVTPRPRQEFFQMYMLGDTGIIGSYFPNDNSSWMPIGLTNQWTLVVSNHMGTTQQVSVIIRIGNSTTTAPNSTIAESANSAALLSLNESLGNEETRTFPFQWNITSVSFSDNYYSLNLDVNGHSIHELVPAAGGKDFRFIFELWSAPTPGETPRFGWTNNGVAEAAWLQVWFNVEYCGGFSRSYYPVEPVCR